MVRAQRVPGKSGPRLEAAVARATGHLADLCVKATYLPARYQMISLFHIVFVLWPVAIGMIACNELCRLLGLRETGPFVGMAVGLIMPFLVTWPLIRHFRLWPLLLKCPMCGTVSPGPKQAPDREGLLVRCNVCEGMFLIRGEWVSKPPDERVFHYHREFIIDILGPDGYPVREMQLAWPYFVARWKPRRAKC